MSVVTLSPALDSGLETFLAASSEVRLKKKETLPLRSHDGGTIYLVARGTLSLALNHEDGSSLILTHLRKGDIFGEEGLFAQSQNKPTTQHLIARTDCIVAGIPHSRFLSLATTKPEVLVSVSKRLNARLQATTQKLACLAFLDISRRLVVELKELCRHDEAQSHPDGMQVKVSRQELARMVNCSREMVGRALKELAMQGLVQVSGKTIVVHGTR